MSTPNPPAVRAYLARVRTALADLPAAEVDEIVEDVRPHLLEIAEGLGDRATIEAMTEQLGSPESYAAEVRAAGDYPPPPAEGTEGAEKPTGSRRAGARLALWVLVLGVGALALVGFAVGREFDAELLGMLVLIVPALAAAGWYVWSRGTGPVAELPEVRRVRSGASRRAGSLGVHLRTMAPAWWVLCAVLMGLSALLLVIRSSTAILVLPLFVGIAALALWAGPRSRTDRRLLWASVPVSVFVFAVGSGMVGYLADSLEDSTSESPYQYTSNTAYDGEPGLYYGDEELENLYVFDADGKPLRDVYLYTEDGRPLTVPRYGCEESTQSRITQGRDNRFPRPHIEQGGYDDEGNYNGYNAYRPSCTESDEVPFTAAIPK
ncbi:HAAS signaling domain-containing protein [Prauserella flavalba]|uniref:HAAS signaling domain-containing protein n=1 Tax=Prauserella flavalba TaxID=1477506 RepID=UPI0036E36C70